jgi:hypothetical protein
MESRKEALAASCQWHIVDMKSWPKSQPGSYISFEEMASHFRLKAITRWDSSPLSPTGLMMGFHGVMTP